MASLTTEQVLALAPDSSSAKAAQGLANPGKWVSLGRNERSVWGECQGSGASPYRTQADLTGPAFQCSCPSRKFPCKHGLGIMLLLAGKPERFAIGEPPAWVAEWISKREATAEKKAAKSQTPSEPADPETMERRSAEREKRAAKREDRVRAGLSELETWLGDLLRQGLAHAKQQPAQYFDNMAARMIDAQAPGVARRLREFPSFFASGDRWADKVLAEAGGLQWLIHGFNRLEALPEGLRASVRSCIGWTVSDQDLAAVETVRDQWQIAAQRVEEEDRLRVQRTWLVGEQSRRAALSLSFAAMNQPLDVSLVAGMSIEADLAFYPSAAPLRAVVGERRGEPRAIAELSAFANFAEALDATASLLQGDPWLERAPWPVRNCIPERTADGWLLRDDSDAVVPIHRRSEHGWSLLALSGGAPMTLFGEWDGESLLPLSLWAEGRFISLGGTLP